MPAEPTFSIITVTLNAERYLEEALESVRSQTFRSFEHIVVDGGSTDGTLSIISRFGDHLASWISEPDAGLYDAFNKGVRLAQNDIIAFLNADDCYADPGVLEAVAEVMRQDPSCVAVYGKIEKRGASSALRQVFGRAFGREDFVRGYMPPHPAFFVRRSAFERIGGFDLAYRSASDFDWVLRLFLAEGERFRFLDRVLTVFRTGGLSSGYRARALGLRETEALLLRHFGERRNLSSEEIENNARFRVWLERLLLGGAGLTLPLRASGVETVAIFGTLTVAEYLTRDCLMSGLTVQALIDNNHALHGQNLHGIPVVPEDWLKRSRPDCLLVSVESDADRALIARLRDAYGPSLRIMSWKELAR
jgi:glycosyltransferase involved in cell wall biosynthesis